MFPSQLATAVCGSLDQHRFRFLYKHYFIITLRNFKGKLIGNSKSDDFQQPSPVTRGSLCWGKGKGGCHRLRNQFYLRRSLILLIVSVLLSHAPTTLIGLPVDKGHTWLAVVGSVAVYTRGTVKGIPRQYMPSYIGCGLPVKSGAKDKIISQTVLHIKCVCVFFSLGRCIVYTTHVTAVVRLEWIPSNTLPLCPKILGSLLH